jgi:acylphosphatase
LGAMAERLHAHVRGRVQAVGFRDFVRREAESARLTGWVRNRPDGSLEIVAEGDPAALERLSARLREGPPLARVEAVDVAREPARGEFSGFAIVHQV